MATPKAFCCAFRFSITQLKGFSRMYWKPALSRFILRICSSAAFAQTSCKLVCLPSCIPHMRNVWSAAGHCGRRVQKETDLYDKRRKEDVKVHRQQRNHSSRERRVPFVGLPLPCNSTLVPHFARSVEGIPVLTCLPVENHTCGSDSLVSARCSERRRHTISSCSADPPFNSVEKHATHSTLHLAPPQKQKKGTNPRGASTCPPGRQEVLKKQDGRKSGTRKCAAGKGKETMEKKRCYRGSATIQLFNADEGVTMMELMVKVQVWESLLFNIQRQGRISFYLTCAGEEASLVGSAAALQKEDIILPQYRELPVLLWRGLSLDGVLAQLFGTQADPAKGRQMPVHYATPGINVQPVSSPLGNKITQAAGVGYALKLRGVKALAVVFFGEGAASEGDAAVGLNFAAALQTQTLFICRNNGFAISTPATEQYKGDGIAARAVAYGIDAIRVDGTDIIYTGVRAARQRALKYKKPVLVEMMTYRVGHHSTSDDSSKYRKKDEVDRWNSPYFHPISRFGRYLETRGRWNQEIEDACRKKAEKEFLQKLQEVEKEKHPPVLNGLFDDVYSDNPSSLEEQRQSLLALLSQEDVAKHYPLHRFAKTTSGDGREGRLN